jgi:LacI family transcriptional regulator
MSQEAQVTITIKDIARFAGVSVGTASKVINQKGSVSPELKMRVEAVVEKLQFRPSALARNVKQQRTQIIGLIVPQIVNSFYVQVVDIIERAINQHGYVLFLGKSEKT